MKKDLIKFLFKIIFLAVVVMALITYCEIKLKGIPNSYTVKKNYFEKNLDSLQILFLGSSESLDGINPKYFDLKGYNLANGLQSLYYDKELIIKYLDRMPRLKYVCISISYFSLWYELYNSPESWLDYCYYHFWDIKPNDPKIFDLKRISYIALYGTYYSQNAFRKNFKMTDINLPTENGWCRQNLWLKFTPTDSTGKARVSLHKTMMEPDLIDKNTGYLGELLDALTKRKVIPVFISIPVYESYFKNADPDKIATMEKVIGNLCEKYHCYYFNNLNNKNFNVDDFADDDHLNLKGSEKYSLLLNDEIIKIANLKDNN